MDSQRFDLVIFDLGSTLIYFEGKWSDVLAEGQQQLTRLLCQQGYSIDEDAFRAVFSARMLDYYRERDTEFIEHTTEYVLRSLLAEFGYPDAPRERLRPALNAMYAVSQLHWQVEADAVATLETLRRQGYRLAILSNASDDQDVQTLIDRAGIRAYFDFILTSAAVGVRKPAPRIFDYVLAHFQVPRQRAVMVGDTLGADILGARNAGIASVWITRRADTPDNRDHEDTIVPDAVIDTLIELLALLVNWDQR